MDEKEEVIKKPKKAKKLTTARKKRQERKVARRQERRLKVAPIAGGNAHQRRKQLREVANLLAYTMVGTEPFIVAREQFTFVSRSKFTACWIYASSIQKPDVIVSGGHDFRAKLVAQLSKAIRRVHQKDIPIHSDFPITITGATKLALAA